MSKNRHRNVDFKIDEHDSRIPSRLPSWQKILNALLVFIIIGNFAIIFIYHKKTGDLNKQIISMKETVTQLENQKASLEEILENQKARFEEFLENHKIIKKPGNYVYESYRWTKKEADGTTNIGLEIDILSEIYRWECGSYERIVRGDKIYNPADIINDYKKYENLKDSKGLICIGMASSEGKRGNEEQRAEKRMETLIDAARKVHVDADCIIYGLNLGQFVGEGKQAPCSDSTLGQRRVVLLKINKQKPNNTDKELLDSVIAIFENKAKSKHIPFPFDIRNYSKYRNGSLSLVYGSSRRTDQYHN